MDALMHARKRSFQCGVFDETEQQTFECSVFCSGKNSASDDVIVIFSTKSHTKQSRPRSIILGQKSMIFEHL